MGSWGRGKAFLLFVQPLLKVLGMADGFATVAGRYACCVLLVTPCMAVQRSIGVWLVARKNNQPRMVVTLVALPLHVAFTWWFTSLWGYQGAGLAMTLSTGLQALLMYFYISCSPRCTRSWQGFSREAFKDWGPYLEVALPGVWMNTEYFVGESLTLAASMLPEVDVCLSALSIYQLTQTTCYQIPSGIRMVLSSRIGNQLGAGEPEKAREAQFAGLKLTLIWLVLPLIVFLSFTRQWGRLFTQNVEVLELLEKLVGLMLLYSSLDALLAYCNGVLSSCGRQEISGRWAIRAYLFVSFPLAMLFAFAFKWGVVGLCLGHCVERPPCQGQGLEPSCPAACEMHALSDLQRREGR